MLSLASNLRSLLPALRASATPGPLDPFWYQPAQMPGPSGIVVKPDNGMKVGPAYACIRVLRECLGSLPWKIYERLPGQDDQEDNRPDPDHYLWPILCGGRTLADADRVQGDGRNARLPPRQFLCPHRALARSGVRPPPAQSRQDAGRSASRLVAPLHLFAQAGDQGDLSGGGDLPRPRPVLERHYGRERAGIRLAHDGPLDRPADARGQSLPEWRPADVLDQAARKGSSGRRTRSATSGAAGKNSTPVRRTPAIRPSSRTAWSSTS